MKQMTVKEDFEIEDKDSGFSVKAKKGDTVEVLRKDDVNGYTVLIGGKTVYIKYTKIMKILFK